MKTSRKTSLIWFDNTNVNGNKKDLKTSIVWITYENKSYKESQ
jgi:hypothetical protein